MATTPNPLVWEFYRSVDGVENLGGVVHYFDEMSQSLYLSSGLKTNVAGVPEGHWETAEQINDIPINDYEGPFLRLDHPSNGILYGVTNDGTTLTFLRYVYGMDISSVVDSWSWLTQTDNAIAQFDGAVRNIDPEIFTDDSSLFQPGSKIRVDIFVGESNAYPIGTAWMDESRHDRTGETVKVSGRNTIGYYLKDQTFDDNTVFKGTVTEILSAIMEYAGLSKFVIQPIEIYGEFEFKPSDTLLKGIETIIEFYATIDDTMDIVELTDGTICIGFEYWICQYLPKNYYTFDEGRELFKRNTTRAADSSYSKLRVTGKDSDGNDLTPVMVDVDNFQFWSLGSHRTKHLTAPDGLTQDGLLEWAEAQARILQYVGVAEEFAGPFRPQLVVGDVGEVLRDANTSAVSLGIITQVKHTFDRQSGFTTEFAVDSGGVAVDTGSTYSRNSNTPGYTVYSRSAKTHGYNRKQSVIDLVRYAAEKVNDIDKITANDVGAEKKGISSTLVSVHNESVFAHSDIREKIKDKLPMPETAEVGQYIRVLSVDENGKVLAVEAVTSSGGGDSDYQNAEEGLF